MCSIANLFNTNIRKFDAKKRNCFLADCKSFGKIWCAWVWTLAENQKHRLLGNQNYVLSIKCSSNFSISGPDFSSYKNEGVGKIGGVVLKRRAVSLIFVLTLSSVIFLWVFGVCVCVCLFCLFTPFLLVLFVSQEEPCLLASNQYEYDFYKWIMFEKKRQLKQNESTGLWMCCVCLCVWYQIRVPLKIHIMCQTSVNLTPCFIKQISTPFWY